MSGYKQKGSKNWWYKFTWHGRQIREGTKQPNNRIAEQSEAAHNAGLAKAEVVIREKMPVPTLRKFIDNEFTPFVESRFASKAKTLEYYRIGLKNLRALELQRIKISSGTLKELSQLPRLEYLNLVGTGVTDDELKEIANIKSLKVRDCISKFAAFTNIAPLSIQVKFFVFLFGRVTRLEKRPH